MDFRRLRALGARPRWSRSRRTFCANSPCIVRVRNGFIGQRHHPRLEYLQGTFAQADRDASRGVAFAQICTFDRRRAPMDGWAVRGCRFDTASGRHASSLLPACAAHCFAAVTARRVAARAALTEWTVGQLVPLPWHGLSAARRFVANACVARCFAGAALSGGSFARGRAVQRCVVFKQPRSLQLFVEGHRPHKADSGA